MDSQKQQAAERIKQANNILVTVSSNPSVDQLAACIGLTLSLNKMGKHATAVYSGSTPSTIEFLQPEKTLEKNTDSLRDFIIALDKSKADKLRYKVEDRVVKIFITPYKTSINEKDLEFSQGDFNVDVVLALGVHNQADLDQAITSHGRILHDATVVTMNVKPGGELGSINWLDPNASSLSELATQLVDMLDKKLIDGQVATALLTGIVAETERFSNSKTSPQTMSISAELMAEGANQQLVATKLEEPAPPPPAPIAQEEAKPEAEAKEEPKKPDDGTLEINHEDKAEKAVSGSEKPSEESNEDQQGKKPEPKQEEPAPESEPKPEPEKGPEEQELPPLPEPEKPKQAPAPPIDEHESVAPQIHIDEHGSLQSLEDMLPPKAPSEPPTIIRHSEAPKMVLEPPTLGGQLTASAAPGYGEPAEAGSLPNQAASTSTPPMAQTITPPTSGSLDYEQPAGGAAPDDNFLVGSGKPTAPVGSGSEPANPQVPDVSNQLPDLPLGAGRTLSDIEEDVHSPHVDTVNPEQPSPEKANPNDAVLPPLPDLPIPQPEPTNPTAFDINKFNAAENAAKSDNNDQPAADVNSARSAVEQAISSSPTSNLDPIQALNAQAVDLPIGSTANSQPVPTQEAAPNLQNSGAPPPVPPPMMPPANPY